MKNNKIAITVTITLIIGVILFLSTFNKKLDVEASKYYQVYLNGNSIGIIDNKDALYSLIDDNQTAIKDEYKVDTVYPPTNLKIIETKTFASNVDKVESIYKKIEEEDDFTIKGYLVSVTGGKHNFEVYVLNKDIFYNATKRFVRAFLNEEEYEKYIENNQEEIVDTGRVIENMKFLEDISIKECYVSVNEHIYTDEADMVHFLLFGSKPNSKSYTIALGDTIESISNANELNVEEFLIANTKYKSEDTILKIGEKVNVTLIDPQLTFVYTIKEIYNQTVFYKKERVSDNTKSVNYSEITTPGINGIERYLEEYSIENGERSQGADPIKIATIQEVQNQVTTYGTQYGTSTIVNPVIIGGDWAWPTNNGYVITSNRGWRWGRMHQGIDVSGAGNMGSPIYAAGDGVVEYVFNGCPSSGRGYGDSCGGSMGNQVIINHGNGYVTVYGHLHQEVKVKVGQTVTKQTRIGSMGNSGSSTGTHLHFEVKYNGVNIDPLGIYR